jgi:hypothetical protein
VHPETGDALDGVVADGPGVVAPQSFQQEWMAAGKLRHPNPGWNMLLFWRFTGPLDRGALLAGLDAVVGRHEVLRSTHAEDGGRAVQVVHPHGPPAIGTVDLRDAEPADRAAELDRLARAQHGLALDHARGPLLAGTLVRAAQDDTYLLLTIDHAVCDGWAVGVLRSELTAAYTGLVTGRGVRLWELPGQYRDFAGGQRAAAAAGDFDRQLDWWGDRLDPGALGLAAAVPSAVDGFRSAQHRMVLPAAVVDRLRRLPGTLYMTLLAGLTGALARRTTTGDVAVASLVAGRRPEHQRLVGMFANPVLVRTAVPAAGSYAELLDRVRTGVTAAGARQEAPWPLVARRAGIAAAEIWLNVAPPPSPARFRGLAVDTDALPHDYPIDVPAAAWHGEMLICNFVDTGPGTEVVGLLDYNCRQLSAATVAELAGDVLDLLTDAGADPAVRLPPPASRPPLPVSAAL